MKLVAIRGDHERVIGEALEVDRQRTHRNQSWQEGQGGDKGPTPQIQDAGAGLLVAAQTPKMRAKS